MSAAAAWIPQPKPERDLDLRPRPAHCTVLHLVWAVADPQPPAPEPDPVAEPISPNVEFYRKYTHALLRRYMRMSLEAGRTPSLIGQEMFRAKVSHYRAESFEDIVVFLIDVDRCLERLTAQQQQFIARISLQEFTVSEVAAALGLDPRTVIAGHRRALDALTRLFLDRKILVPPNCCQ